MSEISFNSIFDGVSLAIHAAFPDRQIHGGRVEQGLMPGDFNVILPGAGLTREVGQRQRRSPTVDVIYYPQGGAAESYAMADRLIPVLESISTPEGDCIHATSCDWNWTDDVLHMILTYDHFAYLPREEVKMETLQTKEEG